LDLELSQRAFSLGRLIGAAVRREPHLHEGEASESEVSWAASGLTVRLLKEATWLAQPLSPPEAAALVGPGRLNVLLAGKLVRIVLGVVEVLPRDLDHVPGINLEDAGDLTKLRDEGWKSERGSLWIADDALLRLRDAHAMLHPSTPPWQTLKSPFEPHIHNGVPGYMFRVDGNTPSGWFSAVLPEAGAKLWAQDITSEPERDAEHLREWLARVGDAVSESPAHMPPKFRERLIRAAASALEEDENLGDFDAEMRGPLVNSGNVTNAPKPGSVAAVYLYWKGIERGGYDSHVDETRDRLSMLLAAIVKHDGAWGRPPSTTIGLAEAGVQKPYLIYELAMALRWTRPDSIAWLIAHRSTAAFGLILLIELELQESTIMDDWRSRATRVHARRMTLVREALPIFARALGPNPVSVEGYQTAAHAVIDLLRALGHRCMWSSLFDTQRNALELQHAEELFALAVAALSSAAPAHRHIGSRPDYQPRLLAEIANELVSQLEAHRSSSEAPEYLKVAHELLRFFQDHRSSFAMRPPGFADELVRTVAAGIYARYVDAMRLVEGQANFRFFSSPRGLVLLPWAWTACALLDGPKLGAWLALTPLRARVMGAASLGDEGVLEIVAGSAARFRVHLEILLRTYRDLPQVLSAQRVTRDRVRSNVEDAVRELILAETDVATGKVDLFDRSLVVEVSEDAIGRLVRLTASTIAAFDGSNSLLEQWIGRTTDAVVLLNLEKELSSPAHRRLIQEKLADPGTLERAENDGWFTSLVDMASEAAASQHSELALRLLKRGDEVTAAHPWRAQWERAAFRARLLLAYHRGSREAVLELPLPPSASGAKRSEVDQRVALERSREFYLALLELAVDPSAARDRFAKQLAEEPGSAALAVNLFAARLREARDLTDNLLRRQAYEDALRWWNGVRASIPDPAGLEPHGILNELIALDGATLDDEFDLRWYRLEDNARGRLELVALRVENLRRRGLFNEQKIVLEVARARYGDALPPELAMIQAPEPAAVAYFHRTTDDYRNSWSEIRGLPPHELARVVGPTRRRELQDFLLHIHVNAVKEMLKRFSTVASLRSEDKMNDLVVSYVDMQVAMFEWSVHDQTRGGNSGSGGTTGGGGVGERDWVVRRQTSEFCVCEALRLASVESTEINKHLEKLVKRYNPQGAPSSFVVIYYEGSGFSAFATRYREFIGKVALSGWLMKLAEGWHDTESHLVMAFRVDATGVPSGPLVLQDHVLVNIGSPDSGTPSVVTEDSGVG
jgi:hypothetical protein